MKWQSRVTQVSLELQRRDADLQQTTTELKMVRDKLTQLQVSDSVVREASHTNVPLQASVHVKGYTWHLVAFFLRHIAWGRKYLIHIFYVCV